MKLLNLYEELSLITEQMLKAAYEQQWDVLLDCQEKYQQLSADLIETSDATTLFDDVELVKQHQELITIYIENILNYQQQLDKLIRQHHTELGQLITDKVNQYSQIKNYRQVANLVN